MSTDSHRDLIVAAIRISTQPLDDDQLAARTGISPRQTVNQVCRALERAGMVRRRPGPDGKIVNEWLGEPGRQPASTKSGGHGCCRDRRAHRSTCHLGRGCAGRRFH